MTDVQDNGQATRKRLGGVTGKGFMPGQSGNPSGMRRRKPITDALVAELDKVIKGGGTNAQKAAEHLVKLMFSRDPRIALEAAKLVMAYVEGLPTQPIAFEMRRAAEDIATRTGADPDWLLKRAQEIAREQEATGATV